MTAMAVRNNLSLIRIVGFGLVETPGLIATVSEPLRESCLNLYGIFTIASSIVLLVDWEHRQEALRLVQMSLRRVAA
jgi:aspartokinase